MFFSRKKREKGSVLLLVILIISCFSLVITWCLSYQIDLGKLGQRRREQMRAFYVADIGIQRVIHWFNHPEEYTPDNELFKKDLTTQSYKDSSGQSIFTRTVSVPSGLLPIVVDANNSYFGELTQLTLLPPDPASDPGGIECIVKVQSTGKALVGPPKTIMVYLDTAMSFNVECPAAIVSEQNAAWGGQFNIHWGEIWTKTNANLPNLSHTRTAFKNDKWLKLKTEAFVMMENGNYADGTNNGSNPPLPSTALNYYQPWLFEPNPNQNMKNIYQKQTVTAPDASDPFYFPQFDYQKYKDYAIQRGKYYIAIDDNNLIRDGQTISVNQFESEITTSDPDNGPYEFIFVDNPNQQNPDIYPSTPMVTLQLSGSGPHSKGVLYIANNVKLGGSGSTPDVTNAADPDNNVQTLVKVRHQGLFYTSGQYDQSGQNTIYGSCVAKGGFGSGGCPEVWYDYRLKYGTLMTVSSNVKRVLWKTY